MRSGTDYINASHVRIWALDWLTQAELLKKSRGRRVCTPVVIWSIVLRAASRMVSVYAACQDLAEAPSSQAVFDALVAGLPKTLPVLERRLNKALTSRLPRRMRRRKWEVAIDWHLEPYYGKPLRSRNELVRSRPKQGTTHFHAYATVCIVEYGQRYTLALTWVRRHESMTRVLRRLLDQVAENEIKIKAVMLDAAFFTAEVASLLQARKLRFLMPAPIRGRKPKKGRPLTGLRWIRRQRAGWYKHPLRHGKTEVEVDICVAYRTHRRRGEVQRRSKKLLFAAWGLRGSSEEICERYRKRFGIESSFRQLRQARIYTCTPDPHLRLVFIAIGLLLRNLWAWIHHTYLREGSAERPSLRLDLLRFKRMLDWINQSVIALIHDGATFCVSDSG